MFLTFSVEQNRFNSPFIQVISTQVIIMDPFLMLTFLFSVFANIIAFLSFMMIRSIKDTSLELNIYNTIRNSRISLMEAIIELSKFEKDEIRMYKNTGMFYEATIEDYVTTYNYACTQYLDKKVNQKRFRKNFETEIANLFENKDISKIVNLNDRTAIRRYDALLEVYQEWFKTER